jgi:hypothetical protein
MRTITTTTNVAGFRFRLTVTGTTIVPAGAMVAPTPRVNLEVSHVGTNGAHVHVSRRTTQTVTRKVDPKKPTPLPARPADTSLAAVLAMPEFAGVPDLLARMAAAYEALEYPVSPSK